MPEKNEKPLKDLFPGRIVKPFIFYADVWKRNMLNHSKMQAYKQMELEEQIQVIKITFSRTAQLVVIEYKTTMPHEWVLEELKKRVVKKEPEQLSIV